MKKDSALSQLGIVKEQLHEEDKRLFPDRHWLTKDSYSKEEMLNMCIYCAEHYEWKKQLEYDFRTMTYFKKP